MIYNYDASLRIRGVYDKPGTISLIIGSCAIGASKCHCYKHNIVPLCTRIAVACENENCPCVGRTAFMHSECYNNIIKREAMQIVESKFGSAKKTGEEAEKSLWVQRLGVTKGVLPMCLSCNSPLVPVMKTNGARGELALYKAMHPPSAPLFEELKVAQDSASSNTNIYSSPSSSNPSLDSNSGEVPKKNKDSAKVQTSEEHDERVERIKQQDRDRQIKKVAEQAAKKRADESKHLNIVKKREAMNLRRAQKAEASGTATAQQLKLIEQADEQAELAYLAEGIAKVLGSEPSVTGGA